ncbi:hypothetical protein [Motiliproteus sp. MSK22-1]|uniref:hypothetical protein n=1 Tax=Motiliproteus sp. MSK22-1 TaxID=1897630 RepID=UPI0013013214|nr:hypothetical protein [Motiliproteus sp. MSK22-1]
MLDFLKKGKNKTEAANTQNAQQEDQFVELKSKSSDQAKEEAKKKSTGCCGSCGGQ